MNPEPLILAPVYVTVLISTFFAVVFGIIFKDMLEYRLEVWKTDDSEFVNYKTPQIRLSYFLTCFSTIVCMGSSLSTFGFPGWMAYGAAFPIVGLTGFLMWKQLGSMLVMMVQDGPAALELE
ncbi:MAG: hypothetical protein ACFB9N_02695 [Geitlerinemataceae cyanobacterium]